VLLIPQQHNETGFPIKHNFGGGVDICAEFDKPLRNDDEYDFSIVEQWRTCV
jgi:hypothetical protein